MSRAVKHIGVGKSPPRLIHRDDEPLGIEQGDMRRQRVEDGSLLDGLAVTQPGLGVRQQKRPALKIYNRIYFAAREFLQAECADDSSDGERREHDKSRCHEDACRKRALRLPKQIPDFDRDEARSRVSNDGLRVGPRSCFAPALMKE
jgi:hypothetical protein